MTWNTRLFERDSYLRGDWIYTGKAFVDESNLAYIGSYNVVNVRFGIELNEQWLLEAFITNLFDEEAWAAGARWTDWSVPTQFPTLVSFQGVVLSPLDKREFGLRANFRF